MKLPLTLLASACLIASAIAQIQTQTVGFNYTFGPGSPVQTITFNEFNPALGTLNSASLQVFGGYQRRIAITATAPFGTSSFVLTSNGVFQAQGPTFIQSDPQSLLLTGSLPSGSHLMTLVGSISSGGPVTPPILYTGTGTFDVSLPFTMTDNVIWTSGSGSNFAQFINQTVAGQAILTYNYTPVPEPATMSLLAIGSLALVSKKRLKR